MCEILFRLRDKIRCGYKKNTHAKKSRQVNHDCDSRTKEQKTKEKQKKNRKKKDEKKLTPVSENMEQQILVPPSHRAHATSIELVCQTQFHLSFPEVLVQLYLPARSCRETHHRSH